MIPGPAYRIRTPRLLIRCWEPSDAPRFMRAVEESREHLRRWLPWVKDEPLPLDEQVKRMRSLRGAFDNGQAFFYGLFTPDGDEIVGGVNALPAGDGARELGGWMHVRHDGRGYATEAGAALTRVAFEVDGMRRVEMHCDPRNEPSTRLPQKLGFVHEATLRARDLLEDGTPSDSMVWSLFADDYPASPCAAAELEAFDAMGRTLL